MGWDKVPYEEENGHDDMLGNGDDIRSGDLGDMFSPRMGVLGL